MSPTASKITSYTVIVGGVLAAFALGFMAGRVDDKSHQLSACECTGAQLEELKQFSVRVAEDNVRGWEQAVRCTRQLDACRGAAQEGNQL